MIKQRTLAFMLALAAAACGSHGRMRVDTPMNPYKAPDISEITGVEEPDASEPPAAAETGAKKE